MGGTAFILGAGASYGDTLEFLPGYSGDVSAAPPNPPLIKSFFDAGHLQGEPPEVEREFSGLVAHIREHWGFDDPFGSGQWTSLSIEDVFTSLALLNDFLPSGTDEHARSQALLNSLTRYIRRSISYSTLFRFGVHMRALAQQLKPEDSVISFNYDLLMDQELLNSGPLQYQNFCAKFLGRDILDVKGDYDLIRERLTESASVGPIDGLYLKLHGSLNWFKCANPACPKSQTIALVSSVAQSLGSAAVGLPFQCNHCQSQLTAFLVPPVVEKRVMTERYLRNIWGNAFALLANVSKVVVIGFSFQPSDFYATWLFRYALKGRKDVKIWVVNPLNDPSEPQHKPFHERMKSIFVHGYEDAFQRFDQITDVITAGL